MIDHLGIAVHDHDASKEFYSKALAPLGIGLIMAVTKEQKGGHGSDSTGFGTQKHPFFWITEGKVGESVHLCFSADERAQVDAFYKAAIAAGAKDNGGPGIRAHYHPNYYGAFVIDLNGVNLEAACHKPG
jgi:catechol 2,3-dioxygenase-like lactoylglutathione lyase family enzyme